MSDQDPPTLVSEAEYLAMERVAGAKYEFWSGNLIEMTGASYAHNRIVGNLLTWLTLAARSGSFDVLASDQKVSIPAWEAYVYPDASLVHGEPVFGGGGDVLTNPCAVFEVLSPSTERFDRGDKLEAYRTLASLMDYVLITQDRIRVEHFAREGDGWRLREYGVGANLRLSGVEAEFVVDELYWRVNLG